MQRGSIHCHGVAKLQSDPNLCDLSQIALRGYLAAQSLAKDQLSHEISLQKQQEVKEGCEAEKSNLRNCPKGNKHAIIIQNSVKKK